MSLLASPFTLMLVVLMVFLGSLLVVVVGLRGRRIGEAPHCRACGYNLTGLSSGRCPECGSVITRASIVIGHRELRRTALAVGLPLLAISAGAVSVLVFGHVKEVDWYTYYPSSLLVQWAKADDAEAISELIRRATDGTLARAESGDLISVGLLKHSANPAPPSVVLWADLLALLDANGWLSPEQHNRFYRQLAPAKIVVRRRIRQGDWLVIAIQIEDRGTRLLPGKLKMRVEDYLIGGESVGYCRGSEWSDVTLGWSKTGHGSAFLCRRPAIGTGNHKVECIVTQAVFDPFADPETADPLWSQKFTLKGELEVLSDNTLDPIRLVENEALADMLQRGIRVQRVTRHSREDGRPDQLNVSLSLDRPAPICLAFDVVAVTDDDEIEVGTVTWPKGEQGYGFVYPASGLHFDDAVQHEIPSEVVLELRASREAASKSMECLDIWNGDLNFGAIQVATGDPIPATIDTGLPPSRREASRLAAIAPPTGTADDPSLVSWSWRPVPPAEGHVSTFPPAEFLLNQAAGLASDRITAITQLADGAMVFGTDAGLSVWRGNELTTYSGPTNSPIDRNEIPGNSSLPGSRIQDLLEPIPKPDTCVFRILGHVETHG